MPMIGLGTWKSRKGLVRDAVEMAIRYGYRVRICHSILHRIEPALKGIPLHPQRQTSTIICFSMAKTDNISSCKIQHNNSKMLAAAL